MVWRVVCTDLRLSHNTTTQREQGLYMIFYNLLYSTGQYISSDSECSHSTTTFTECLSWRKELSYLC